jgi:hypothetical protein
MAIVLTALLAAAPLSSPFLQAALVPTFSAGGNQYPNVGSINVPITVVSDFTTLQGVQFSLQWTPGVLQYVGTGNYNSTLTTAGPFLWSADNVASGLLGFVWADNTVSGQTLSDGAPIFTVQFNVIGGIGTSSPISFVGKPPGPTAMGASDIDFNDLAINGVDGLVTVVPEPINWALGLFACVFVGSATVRWASNRKMA